MAKLESTLIAHFRPSFLLLDLNKEGNIEIIISCEKFNYQNVQARISEIFSLINRNCPETIKDKLVIAQAYNSNQMTDLLEDTFNGNQ